MQKGLRISRSAEVCPRRSGCKRASRFGTVRTATAAGEVAVIATVQAATVLRVLQTCRMMRDFTFASGAIAGTNSHQSLACPCPSCCCFSSSCQTTGPHRSHPYCRPSVPMFRTGHTDWAYRLASCSSSSFTIVVIVVASYYWVERS